MPASSLLDHLVPFHLELDGDLRVRRAGPGLRAILGDELGGRSLFDLVSVVQPALAAPESLLAWKGGTTLRCELHETSLPLRAQLLVLDGGDGFLFAAWPWTTDGGELRSAELGAAPAVACGGCGEFFAQTRLLAQQHHDVKTLAAQLEDRDAHLGAIVDAAIDAVLTIDENCRIERINPAAVRLFGYAPRELIGREIWALMPSLEDGRDVEFLEILAISGIRGEVDAMSRGGRTFAAELSVSKLVVQGRTRFTGILRDISERKKLELLQSEFVSTVSHELRTPLTAIRGALGLVAGGVTGALPPEAEECVLIALSNSDRLIRIINDILDQEKIQSGQMDFRMETLELGAVVTAGIQANATFAAAHDIQLRLLAEPAAGEVVGDRHRLIQVVTNLISNASKFSPPGEVVDVSVESRGDVMRVSVRDRGQGVPEEFRDRIFQRFAQADGSSTRQRGGTGLGLSISKTIVEKMHGHIGFEAAAGGGTVFFFDLPRAPASAS